jgi:hypothetical protein
MLIRLSARDRFPALRRWLTLWMTAQVARMRVFLSVA